MISDSTFITRIGIALALLMALFLAPYLYADNENSAQANAALSREDLTKRLAELKQKLAQLATLNKETASSVVDLDELTKRANQRLNTLARMDERRENGEIDEDVDIDELESIEKMYKVPRTTANLRKKINNAMKAIQDYVQGNEKTKAFVLKVMATNVRNRMDLEKDIVAAEKALSDLGTAHVEGSTVRKLKEKFERLAEEQKDTAVKDKGPVGGRTMIEELRKRFETK